MVALDCSQPRPCRARFWSTRSTTARSPRRRRAWANPASGSLAALERAIRTPARCGRGARRRGGGGRVFACARPGGVRDRLDCPGAACGGQVCDWSSGTLACAPAGSKESQGTDGECATNADCKCAAQGAVCRAPFCSFTLPPDAGAGGTAGTAGASGAGGGGVSGNGGLRRRRSSGRRRRGRGRRRWGRLGPGRILGRDGRTIGRRWFGWRRLSDRRRSVHAARRRRVVAARRCARLAGCAPAPSRVFLTELAWSWPCPRVDGGAATALPPKDGLR